MQNRMGFIGCRPAPFSATPVVAAALSERPESAQRVAPPAGEARFSAIRPGGCTYAWGLQVTEVFRATVRDGSRAENPLPPHIAPGSPLIRLPIVGALIGLKHPRRLLNPNHPVLRHLGCHQVSKPRQSRLRKPLSGRHIIHQRIHLRHRQRIFVPVNMHR